MTRILVALGMPLPSNFSSVMLVREVEVSLRWLIPSIKDVIFTAVAAVTLLPDGNVAVVVQ